MDNPRPGVYRHYKKGEYLVLGVALHTETGEKMVLYRALYPCPDLEEKFGKEFAKAPVFVRPCSQFMEEVEFEGKRVPRFAFVREK